jgi:hypothetical protein
MNTDVFITALQKSQDIRKRAQERRKRNAELRQFLLGGSLVMSGLLLAAVCNLLR